jgi:hypothetical protein
MRTRVFAAVALSTGLTLGGLAAPADAATHYTTYKNCTAMHAKYKHGVGKKGAKDKVTGKTKPVTNFYVSNGLYAANKKLDRDKDGIACEKR